MYQWRNDRLTFEIIGGGDGIKCEFTSVKEEESHKWYVHLIHGPEIIGKVMEGATVSDEIAGVFATMI